MTKIIIIIICVATIILGKSSSLSAQAVDKGDSMALVDLYNSTDGPHWIYHDGWLEKPVKDWRYITLTLDGTRVKEVYLPMSNLNGEIPSSLGNLSSCESITLNSNKLKGEIPASFANLSNLINLFLYDNQLTGKIPESLSRLSKLKYLDLASNRLKGRIPDLSLVPLTSLYLQYNKFTFDGMESLTLRRIQNFFNYSQDTILPIARQNATLSVSAGGNLKNNSYYWYRAGILDTVIIGDSNFVPKRGGNYSVIVHNSIATGFDLKSEVAFALAVLVVDPNPTMITANGSIDVNLSNIDYDNTVTKAATDGVTKLLLTTNSSSPITFTINGNISGTLSSIDNQLLKATQIMVSPDASGRVVCIYTVPDGYGIASPQGERNCTITATGSNNYTSTVNIKLVTPPVVLVHGIWSNPVIWEKGGFTSYLRSAGIEKLYLADYSYSSSLTFDPNSIESYPSRVSLLVKIILALKDYRDHKIAVTQVDVVGHSLGGLMTRSLSQQSSFLTQSNYYEGYVHKLITLGTPHRGSPLGPELYKQKDTWSYQHIPGTDLRFPYRLSDLLELIDMPIGSCLKDFGITSQGVRDLTNTLPFKTYAITATNGVENNFLDGIASHLVMDALINFVSGRSLDEVMKSRCDSTVLPNDLIVPYRSQTGYITSTQLFRGTSHSIPGLITETNNPLIQRRVGELLLSSDTTEFSQGFPAPSGFPLESCDNATQRSISNLSSGTEETSKNVNSKIISTGKEYVRLSAPLRGSVFHQDVDTAITVGYEALGGAVPTNALLMIQNVGWYKLPVTAPYSINVNLPKDIQIGSLNIVLLVNDTTGIKLSDTSHITLLPGSVLSSVTLEPSSIYLDSMNRQTRMLVHEEFQGKNGIQLIDVSSVSEGVSYATQKGQSIIKVSDDGIITAVNAGTDTLIVTVGDSTFKVPLIVDNSFLYRKLYANTIDFKVIPNKMVSDQPFALEATVTSGESVNFTLISGPVEIINGIVITKGEGLVTVQASSTGNAYFNAAVPVIHTFYVGSVLPVQLLNFTGSLVGDDVLLKWSTANEQNSSRFIVERSTDGLHFVELATVNAAGNGSGVSDYNFKDTSINSLPFSNVFYRLKEVDKDGKPYVSNVIIIAIKNAKTILIYPNPAKRTINVLFNKQDNNNSIIKIYSLSGKLVVYQKLTGSSNQEIQLPVLSNGNYKITISSKEKVLYQTTVMIAN